MKYTHPEIGKVLNTECAFVNSLVVENQELLCRLICDLKNQVEGMDGVGTISEHDMPVSSAKSVEVLDMFVPFQINRKPLLTKLTAALERRAADADLWERTGKMILEVSEYLEELAFDFPCDIAFPKVSVSGLVKGAAPEFRDTYGKLAEKVIDYMELVRTFDKDKLFFTVNMRSFVSDDEMERFLRTVLAHEYHVILLEGNARERLPSEQRWIIDEDLCEIDG